MYLPKQFAETRTGVLHGLMRERPFATLVVMTTSRDNRDVRECYRAGANSYIQKPLDLTGFQRALRTLRDYWFDVVVLPPGD